MPLVLLAPMCVAALGLGILLSEADNLHLNPWQFLGAATAGVVFGRT